MKKITLFLGLLLLTVSLSAQAKLSRKGTFETSLGGGLALKPPTRFDLQAGAQYYLMDELSVGVDTDILFRGRTAYDFTGIARYHVDINEIPELVPYFGTGAGASVNSNGNGLMDIVLPDFGLDYELADNLLVGFDASAHLLTNFDSNTWDFRILPVRLTYRF